VIDVRDKLLTAVVATVASIIVMSLAGVISKTPELEREIAVLQVQQRATRRDVREILFTLRPELRNTHGFEEEQDHDDHDHDR
jgi:hypothetical protein